MHLGKNATDNIIRFVDKCISSYLYIIYTQKGVKSRLIHPIGYNYIDKYTQKGVKYTHNI